MGRRTSTCIYCVRSEWRMWLRHGWRMFMVSVVVSQALTRLGLLFTAAGVVLY